MKKAAKNLVTDESISNEPAPFMDFLRAAGYRVEQTFWDSTDLPLMARQLIAQMELVSHP